MNLSLTYADLLAIFRIPRGSCGGLLCNCY